MIDCGPVVVLTVRPTGGGRGWVGEYEGTKKLVYLKRASHFWPPIPNFNLHQRKLFSVLGGWVVWPGGWVREINPPPPPSLRISTSLMWSPEQHSTDGVW